VNTLARSSSSSSSHGSDSEDEKQTLSDVEIGMKELQKSLKDPKLLAEAMEMLKDPEIAKEVRAMMADPKFQKDMKKMTGKFKYLIYVLILCFKDAFDIDIYSCFCY